ncbi:hypothetical protein CIY79_08660 [Salmonella enterica subsp. enterica serovar Oranienburg]|nr:hypothetical protein [Salmonella enterica subsp. enterica serovar Oranienburg]
MVAQSLLDPITMATRAGLLREDMRLKTPVVRDTLLLRCPCGAGHAAFEVSENSMIIRQGKRLRVRRNGRFDEHLQGEGD